MTGYRTHIVDRQSGSTLLVGLIMLVLLTLLALSAMRLANTNLKVVGNEQFQREAQAASAFALDAVANSTTFVTQNAKTVDVDVGQATYSVAVTKPLCKRYRVIPKSDLVTVVNGKPVIAAGDVACFTGTSSSPLTIVETGAISAEGQSLCAATLWEVEATARPATGEVNVGTEVVMREGIEQRISVPDGQGACI